MSAVGLKITKPTHAAVFVGTRSVDCAGQVTSLPAALAGVTLYYRWYSSLFPAAKDRYSINATALTDPAGTYTAVLSPGSHILTLAASDRPGETEADQNATRHGGVTGGAQGDGACIIHVFVANLLQPDHDGAALSLSAGRLRAEAPLHWESQQVNRLQYRCRFVPSGPPAGRPTVEAVVPPSAMTFDASGAVPAVQWAPPAGLVAGGYVLTLRVEDIQNNATGHQVARTVQVVA